MSGPSGIFEPEIETLDPNTEVPNTNEENLVETLVGEGRKFKDLEALAKGKILADAHIKQIQEENAKLKKELGEKKKIEDFMTEFKTFNRNDPVNTPRVPTVEGFQDEGTKVLDTNEITERVLKELEQKNRLNQEQANIDKVKSELRTRFGIEWQKKLKEFSDSVAMDEETLVSWIKRSPDGVLNAVGSPTKVTPGFTTPSSITPPNSTGGVSGTRDWKYYQGLKAKDSKAYWSHEVQLQMHRDALKLGANFYPKEN